MKKGKKNSLIFACLELKQDRIHPCSPFMEPMSDERMLQFLFR